MFSHEELGFLAIYCTTAIGVMALIVHAVHAHHERRQRKKQKL
jgi:hypothetical protein